MSGGFHPFHAGHASLYQQAKETFPDATVLVCATNVQSDRPFPFALKKKLAQLSGVPSKDFIEVSRQFTTQDPALAKQIGDPNDAIVIYVRSEKDRNDPPTPWKLGPDGKPPVGKKGKPLSDYLLEYPGEGQPLDPVSKHAYMAYLKTVEFGPGITSATQIRNAWPTLNDKRKTALVMSLYPTTQQNPKLAQTVVGMFDQVMGGQVSEGAPFVVPLAPIHIRNPKKAPQPYRNQGDIVPPTKPPSTEKRGVKGRPGQRPMPTYEEVVAEGNLDEGVNDPHTFKCIFLFGPMGAGKSTVARPLLSHTGLRSVNLDNFNEMFIKKGQVPTGHLSPDQLEKSWQLSQTQQQNFIDGRLGIIIDGSGRNPSTAIGVIEKLQPLGYEFMMIFVNVSEATSIARQQSRADKQQQQWGVGRQVDPTLAKNTYAQVQQNLGKYSAYFGPQRFVYVDNENTPDLTQATKKVDAFLNAPVTQPEAIGWIQAQKGGQQVAQKQQKLATAQDRQQQALKQFNPLNPKFAKKGMAEGFGDVVKGIKRASQGWGVGAAPDMVTPSGAVSAFKNMDGQRLANFVASRKDQSKPRKNSAGAFVDKVIDREMRQRGYSRVANKDEQGVAEDDAGDVEQRFTAKMEKEKQRLAKLKQTDPEAYKREMAQREQSRNRMPAVSTFEQQGVAEDTDKEGYHTRVRRGDFRPSKYGEDEYNYLHDLMNTSGDSSGPQLVTINDKKIARQIATMYGADVEETGMGTYRIVQRRGDSPMSNKRPKLTGVAEGSGPKEKQKTPYRDINSPEYKAAADKQKQRMDKDKAAEPGKKMLSKQGVAEGSNDTIYPNAEVIKSKNGKPVGEIYQDGNSWGAFHYKADRGYDFIDSREEAIEALKDLHQETGRSRPDYTIKGVAEGDKKPYPKTWHDVDPKLGKQVDKMTQAEKVKKGLAHPDTLKKPGVAEGSEASDDLVSTLNSFGYYSDNGSVYVNDTGEKIARQGSAWKHQSGKLGRGAEELGEFLSSEQGVEQSNISESLDYIDEK